MAATAQEIVDAYKSMGYKVERFDPETVVMTKEDRGVVIEQVIRRHGRNITRRRR